jgi:branched-chain amino acid transport system permease protein
MVYGILGIINFAHGEVLMIGAMVSLTLITLVVQLPLGLPAWFVLLIILLITMGVCAVLSYLIERFAYRPLRGAPRLAPLISAIGVSVLLQTLAMMIWSRNPLTYPQLLPSTPIAVFGSGATITGKEIIIIATSVLVMTLLLVIVQKTRLGRAMRATAEQPQIAALMGVNPNRVISITFMLGGALAALAGIMMATNYGNVHFSMGFIPGLKAFTAAVLGGIGNIQGAMLGGLLLGLIEALGAGYIGDWTGGVLGSNYQDIFAFLVLILVLVFRPRGLLGEKVSDRA